MHPSPAAPPADTRRRRPHVSACIVNWNCLPQLRACLRSLTPRRQGVRLEVIVVDNASTDGAPDAVAAEFPHVTLIRNADNAGYARACNQAARAASGRHLLFLNNDTVIPRGAVRRMLLQARANPDLGILGPRLVGADGRVQRSVRGRPTVAALCHRLTLLRWTGLFRSAHDAFAGRDAQAPAEVLLGAALFMPRRVWKAVGGWDENYRFGGEDIDLCLRVGRTHRVLHDPDTSIIHLGRVATRHRPGFVHGNTIAGLTRSLRTAGSGEPAILLYKLLATLDVPVRLAELALRWAWDRLRGRSGRRAGLDLAGLSAFAARHLWSFWRA